MLWSSSPAGTEIEQVLLDGLAAALGLGGEFTFAGGGGGSLQDSASSAALVALVAALQRSNPDWREHGVDGADGVRHCRPTLHWRRPCGWPGSVREHCGSSLLRRARCPCRRMPWQTCWPRTQPPERSRSWSVRPWEQPAPGAIDPSETSLWQRVSTRRGCTSTRRGLESRRCVQSFAGSWTARTLPTRSAPTHTSGSTPPSTLLHVGEGCQTMPTALSITPEYLVTLRRNRAKSSITVTGRSRSAIVCMR